MLFYKGDRESIKVNRVTALFYIVIVYWMVRVDREDDFAQFIFLIGEHAGFLAGDGSGCRPLRFP